MPTAGGFGWGFVAPRANLYGDNGKLLMTHFGGPTWQAKDGSKVVAQRVDGVTVDPTAIPWLLLSAAVDDRRPGRRPPRRHDLHPAHRDHRRPRPAAADCNAEHVGTRERSLHRRLLLLEADAAADRRSP